MQISRHYLLAFAVAACLTPSLVRAYDNEVQIRARQALEEKMNQLNAQAPAPAAVPTNTVPKAAAPKPAPVAKPAPVEKPAPPVITVTPQGTTVENRPAQTTAPAYVTTPSNDSATSDKLSDALHQKMQEVGSQPTETAAPAMAAQKPAKPTAAPKYAPAPANNTATAATSTQVPATEGNYAPLPQGSSSHPNLPEQPTPQAAPTMAHNQPTPPSMNLPALSGPPSSLSPAKQQKLDDLLQQYRADQLSPQQYHEQRAKILAEP